MKTLVALLLLPLGLHAQLLQNAGFESGTDGWKIIEKEPISTVTGEAAHAGKSGLRITDESKELGANVSNDRFPVTPGQKVTIGFWGRSTVEGIGAVMVIPYTANNRAILDEKGKQLFLISIKKDLGDWDRYDAEFIVPDEATSVGISIRTWTGSTGTADLDDFELKIE